MYASARIGGRAGRNIKLHRFLWIYWGLPLSHLDHINGDGLDNRRANLRAATPMQNSANTRRPKNNTSGYKGVSRVAKGWRAMISINRRNVWLGVFATPEDAAAAYWKAAVATRGEFARAA